MCGIFAYLNWCTEKEKQVILEYLLGGLYTLEYRGYDSAGLAFCTNGEQPEVLKKTGNVNELESHVKENAKNLQEVYRNTMGMAHTRWATHGEPSDINSHPHVSNSSNSFIVVHNGIITNYKTIREMLVRHGYEFYSDTDTETIPKLCEFFYQEDVKNNVVPNLMSICDRAIDLLEGAYAVVIMSPNFPDEMVGAKQGSPMVLGIKDSSTNVDDTVKVRDSSNLNVTEIGSQSRNNSLEGKFNVPDGNRRRPSTQHELAARFLESGSKHPTLINSPRRNLDTEGLMKISKLSSDNPQANLLAAEGVEYFISSDVTALVGHTDKVIFLEDNDRVHITQGRFQCFQPGANNLERTIRAIDIELDEISKGGYEHYMLKEIHEQQETVLNTMRGRVDFENYEVRLGGLNQHIDSIRRCRRLVK